MFWPSYNASVLGTHFFIWGSEVVCLSQCWKLYRSGCNSPSDPISTKFKLANLTFDKTATLVDLFAFVGGVQYLIGCIYFLPEYNVSDYHTNLAATLFVLGGKARHLLQGHARTYVETSVSYTTYMVSICTGLSIGMW